MDKWFVFACRLIVLVVFYDLCILFCCGLYFTWLIKICCILLVCLFVWFLFVGFCFVNGLFEDFVCLCWVSVCDFGLMGLIGGDL